MKFTRLAPLFALLIPAPAFALHNEIDSPVVEKGEAEIEYDALRTSDSDPALNNAQEHKLELNYGFTDDFSFGLIAEGVRDNEDGFHATGIGFEAIYQMTAQKDWWLNSGLYLEALKSPHDGEADGLEGKLLLSRQQGPVNVIANLIFEREVGPNRDHGVTVGSALQATYDVNKHFQPGVEWHAEYGKLNDFSDGNDQDHAIGPIVKGQLFSLDEDGDEDEGLNYLVGYYWGLTDASANHGARIELEYEFDL